jgi:hypothetical protein
VGDVRELIVEVVELMSCQKILWGENFVMFFIEGVTVHPSSGESRDSRTQYVLSNRSMMIILLLWSK